MTCEQLHLEAMQAMSALMQNPDAIAERFANKEKEFDALPEDSAQ